MSIFFFSTIRQEKETEASPLCKRIITFLSSVIDNSHFWTTTTCHSIYKQCWYHLFLIEFRGAQSLQIIGLGVNWGEGFPPVFLSLAATLCHSESSSIRSLLLIAEQCGACRSFMMQTWPVALWIPQKALYEKKNKRKDFTYRPLDRKVIQLEIDFCCGFVVWNPELSNGTCWRIWWFYWESNVVKFGCLSHWCVRSAVLLQPCIPMLLRSLLFPG